MYIAHIGFDREPAGEVGSRLAAAGHGLKEQRCHDEIVADELAARYPAIQVDAKVLYVDDGDVLTSAGSAAGLDLCLHLVRTDFGATIANAVARRLVVQPHRSGGQAQFIESPVNPEPGDDRIMSTMEWALSHLNSVITVDELARRSHLSSRSFLRHFQRTTGTSPIRWLIAQRVQASLPLLETTNASIDQLAWAVGFETATTFRHHAFLRPAQRGCSR